MPSQLPDGVFANAPVRISNPFLNVEASTPISNNWCIIGMDTVDFSFICKIDHFSMLQEKTGECLESSSFFAGPNNEFEWRLQVYPKGSDEKSKDHLSLFLKLVSCERKETEVPTRFKISILNAKNEKSYAFDGGDLYRFMVGTYSGWPSFIGLDMLQKKTKGLLPEGCLTILCEGCITGVRIDTSGHVAGFQAEVAACTLSKDLASIFENQKLSDVTLSVGQKNLLAHKAILAARSPVFAAMFQHEMLESEKNRVVIRDVDYEVLSEMLVYIYTGKSPNLNSMSSSLLAAADKYDVSGLKLICQEALCSTIAVDNVVDLLVLADQHYAKQLKLHAIHFINMHAKDVINTSAWKKMILKSPHLFAEAFEALARKS